MKLFIYQKAKVYFNFTAFLVINLFIVSALLFSTFAQARTAADVEKDLKKAARSSVATYKKGGMSGLISATQGCYNKLDKNKFYCVYFDLASRHIDQIFIEGTNFPPNDFFADEQFGPRVAEVFTNANMNMTQCNDYLAKMTPIINKLVEDILQNKRGK
jgi:hypothetical protein